MRRREFVTLLGGAAAAPLLPSHSVHAQQPAMPVIGFLHGSSAQNSVERAHAFRQALSEAGLVDGSNLKIEFRWAENQNDRLPTLAVDLVGRQPSAIAAFGLPSVMAAKAATAAVPIVFHGGFDPVALGVVASLNRPGGNITGVTQMGVELGPKRLELLHELMPAATTVALLVNPTNSVSSDTQWKHLQAAARMLKLQPTILQATGESDFEAAFTTVARQRAGGLVISNDGLFNGRAGELGALALRHAVPTIFQFQEFTASGGLMSYGGSLTEGYGLAGVYIGRILKGEKPADLPVQQATKVELIINLKTAKSLDISVPLSLLGRADEVIE